jgi:hypothetical protein
MRTLQITHATRRLRHAAAGGALFAGSILAASITQAHCGDPAARPSRAAMPPPFAVGVAQPGDYDAHSIVGLWHVTYTVSDGSFFYEALDHWHGDGTEFESANFNPIMGDVCLGIWKATGSYVRLNHFGWDYDTGGNPAGSFNLREQVTLATGGASYSGTFEYTAYDTAGNVVPPVLSGTINATRITMRQRIE